IQFPVSGAGEAVVRIMRRGLLSGHIATGNGDSVPGITLRLNGQSTTLAQTDHSGEYRFDIYEPDTYTLGLSDDVQNQNSSVDLADLVPMQQFPNGQHRFEDPFSLIAADADGSRAIDEKDLGFLKILLLKKAKPQIKPWVI